MPPIQVIQSTPETAYIIHNLYPLYLHDLSEFTTDLPNPHGIYEPDPTTRTLADQSALPYQNIWWQNPHTLFSFLILSNNTPAGFALISTPPYAPKETDFCVEEFFIIRPHRATSLAEQAAINIFNRFQGQWEIAVLPRNQKASAFWRRTLTRHTHGNFQESPSSDGSMLTFRFNNTSPSQHNSDSVAP